MLENIEPIVLDATNNVFVGPNEFFKIVIDEFDGETVQAWHIEDSEGNVSENLARRAGGNHIDLLVNKNVRTVWHFGDRIATDLVSEEQEQRIALEEQMAALQTELADLLATWDEVEEQPDAVAELQAQLAEILTAMDASEE